MIVLLFALVFVGFFSVVNCKWEGEKTHYLEIIIVHIPVSLNGYFHLPQLLWRNNITFKFSEKFSFFAFYIFFLLLLFFINIQNVCTWKDVFKQNQVLYFILHLSNLAACVSLPLFSPLPSRALTLFSVVTVLRFARASSVFCNWSRSNFIRETIINRFF